MSIQYVYDRPESRGPNKSSNSKESPEDFPRIFWTLLTFSLLISEDFWIFLSFPSDRSVFCPPTNVLKKNAAIAGKIKEKPKILTN